MLDSDVSRYVLTFFSMSIVLGIIFIASPEESFSLIIGKLFFLSLIPFAICVFLGFNYFKENQIMNFIVIGSVPITVFATPIGLIYHGYSNSIAVNVLFSTVVVFPVVVMYVLSVGLQLIGLDFGTKLRNWRNPEMRSRKIPKRRKRRDAELYPK